MGIEVALLVAAVGASIAGGVVAHRAAEKQADAQEEQGRIARAEARTAAAQRAQEIKRFSARQRLAFLKSGVTLEGSPLLVNQETIREGAEEVEAIRRRGSSQQRLFNQRASQSRSSGRAALIGSVGQAAGTAAGGFGTGGSSAASGTGGNISA